jgi:tetratricopeptide (TPR) repeat protein
MANLIAAAEARAARGDYAGAREIAQQAQRADALDYRPIYLLAQLAEIEGDDAEALRKLAQVLYLAPHFIPACLDTAAHLERLGDPDRAMRHRRAARRLLEAQPDEQAMQPPYQACASAPSRPISTNC